MGLRCSFASRCTTATSCLRSRTPSRSPQLDETRRLSRPGDVRSSPPRSSERFEVPSKLGDFGATLQRRESPRSHRRHLCTGQWLGHYTSASVAFECILPMRQMRMSSYRLMRDPATRNLPTRRANRSAWPPTLRADLSVEHALAHTADVTSRPTNEKDCCVSYSYRY